MLTDRLVELIDEGMDVVVRIGAPKDSGLVMRKLVDNHRIVVGAPDYLDRHGTPMAPSDLEAHECLQYRGVGTHWRLVGRGGRDPGRLPPAVRQWRGGARLGARRLRSHHKILGGRGARRAHRPSGSCVARVAQRPCARLRTLPFKSPASDAGATISRCHGGSAQQVCWWPSRCGVLTGVERR
jgi:hypothetical protein